MAAAGSAKQPCAAGTAWKSLPYGSSERFPRSKIPEPEHAEESYQTAPALVDRLGLRPLVAQCDLRLDMTFWLEQVAVEIPESASASSRMPSPEIAPLRTFFNRGRLIISLHGVVARRPDGTRPPRAGRTPRSCHHGQPGAPVNRFDLDGNARGHTPLSKVPMRDSEPRRCPTEASTSYATESTRGRAHHRIGGGIGCGAGCRAGT